MEMTPRSTITGKMLDRGRQSVSSNRGRMSVASSYSVGSMDLTYRDYFGPPNYTPFDESMVELDFIKVRTKMHVKRMNSLKHQYVDWFSRKCQTFLDGIKLTQILSQKLVPEVILTMQDFKKVHAMSRRFPRNGTPRDSNPAKLDDFFMFWMAMTDLKEETDSLYEALCKYCDSITRLRHPFIKEEVDLYKQKLDEAYSEEYDFSDVKNERDNLFTYKVASFDHRFHGLLNYIPYLMTMSVRMLALFGKIHLEKE
ncbi:uncharacterized protein LOC127879263 isoform X2 [Dreissena polymorpha]|uniref:uncharacterized protein LOC127879263 isoform X2 n=1 Tax=Dreissena polymorpha TaxID=45954 RepID=UPI002263D01D|nr:uncharacterized protein LOC127879263 isoform X2 [Dreissena polymorpha]